MSNQIPTWPASGLGASRLVYNHQVLEPQFRRMFDLWAADHAEFELFDTRLGSETLPPLMITNRPKKAKGKLWKYIGKYQGSHREVWFFRAGKSAFGISLDGIGLFGHDAVEQLPEVLRECLGDCFAGIDVEARHHCPAGMNTVNPDDYVEFRFLLEPWPLLEAKIASANHQT